MPPRAERSEEIFGKFSENAIQVLIRTWSAAVTRNHRDIGGGLLLHGLIGDETVKQVFEELGSDMTFVSQAVEGINMRYSRSGRRRGKFRLLPDTKNAIQLTVDEFKKDGAAETTPLHLLRGLTLVKEGPAIEILTCWD